MWILLPIRLEETNFCDAYGHLLAPQCGDDDFFFSPVFLSLRTSSVWPVTGCCWPAVAWPDRSGFGTLRPATV